MLQLGEGVLSILTREAAIKKAQDLVAKHTDGRGSLADELLTERRGEATRE